MQNSTDIIAEISNLSDRHLLKNAPKNYIQGFAEAAVRVYPIKSRASILQDKFFIPNDAAFNIETYLQSASELTVQNHLAVDNLLKDFAIEKQVNPPKDVDCYYEVSGTRVSLEVKCAIEIPAPQDALVYKTAGRVPNREESFSALKGLVDESNPGKDVVVGKNKDNTMKDFLLSAHSKFPPSSGVDALNVLFVSCGDYFNIQDWWFHLLEKGGLFTDASFHPPSEFGLVDVVIISNLKYCHAHAQQNHDWTLRDVFILPVLNPKRRQTALSESITNGLSVFDHHLKKFSHYSPSENDPGAPKELALKLKVNSYVVDGLAEGLRERYFPSIQFDAPPVNPPK